jgi:putative membrane protein
MKETPHKVVEDPAPERTHKAAERPILGWIRNNLFPQKKETPEAIETALKVADILAYERTRMAADRTLMGWIRTALSMIGFGFTIYKFMQSVQSIENSRLASKQSPEAVGLTLIGIGVFSLTIACLQHWKYIKNLRPDMPYKPWDLTFIVAFLIGSVGVVMFISIVLHAGPLG